MPDETEALANTLSPGVRNRAVSPRDVPEHLERRYYLDGRGGAGVGFYVDAQVKAPAFRDQGRKLAAARNDPNAIRDMVAIARHRGWTIVVVTGSQAFRREAWIASRAAGLEVRGYRPTERDLQALERRSSQQEARGRKGSEPSRPARAGADASLRVVEAVVRNRIAEPARQDEILSAARARVASWLERGARFDGGRERAEPGRSGRQRERNR